VLIRIRTALIACLLLVRRNFASKAGWGLPELTRPAQTMLPEHGDPRRRPNPPKPSPPPEMFLFAVDVGG